MDSIEATSVCNILVQADGGGCSNCASELLDMFKARFPEWEDIAEEVFKREFSYLYED